MESERGRICEVKVSWKQKKKTDGKIINFFNDDSFKRLKQTFGISFYINKKYIWCQNPKWLWYMNQSWQWYKQFKFSSQTSDEHVIWGDKTIIERVHWISLQIKQTVKSTDEIVNTGNLWSIWPFTSKCFILPEDFLEHVKGVSDGTISHNLSFHISRTWFFFCSLH